MQVLSHSINSSGPALQLQSHSRQQVVVQLMHAGALPSLCLW